MTAVFTAPVVSCNENHTAVCANKATPRVKVVPRKTAFVGAEGFRPVLGRMLQRLPAMFTDVCVYNVFRGSGGGSGLQFIPMAERFNGADRKPERPGDSFISHALQTHFLYISFLTVRHGDFLHAVIS